jgi:hypothetical protein
MCKQSWPTPIYYPITFEPDYYYYRGTRWHSWLRHYATSRKVTGSSPDEVDFFN